ncbi:MAG: HAD family phosphatase, partial [Polyangiaceae bacterium]|nr:HAD family phosphatase [Polyangiaceae bacterium]
MLLGFEHAPQAQAEPGEMRRQQACVVYMCRPMSRPRALIFDLDGLLIDSEPTWFVVEGSFLAELGHTWTRQDADSCMGQGTSNTLRIWQQRFGVKVDIARDTERIVDRMIARAPEMPLKSGARALVSSARAAGLRLAVASSSPRRLIEAVLRAKQLDTSMDAVVSGQEVPRGKPAPDVFLRAAELLGVEPAACVVLEDALAGVKAARAANMRVLAVPTVAADAIARLATWVT